MKVFVALSGGVDSAVAAHMLQKEGHNVTAVFIRVWQPDFLDCSQDEEERAALRVAAYLGIPFKRLDASETYKKNVVDLMIAEYNAGRTPNPDVLCNREIKFGHFWEYAKKAGADAIATGHHAQVITHNEQLALARGKDPAKDQAYFLWQLTQGDLQHTHMPVGALTKEEVRAYAQTHELPSAEKPDSQGLCFMGDVNMKEFLSHYVALKPGNVLSLRGDIVGEHHGAAAYTLGQRVGFFVSKGDLQGATTYVVDTDVGENTITVDTKPAGPHMTSTISLCNSNWMHTLEKGKDYSCEIRYHGKAYACKVEDNIVHVSEPVTVAAGQSVVVYDKSICIGGGVVV